MIYQHRLEEKIAALYEADDAIVLASGFIRFSTGLEEPADILGIDHYVMNFRKEFREQVIDDFLRCYLSGTTPDPCNRCNRYIKWESLLSRSMQIGADYIATGHYARIVRLENGRFAVAKSVTEKKDQTYALYNLTQNQLKHTFFPVGEFHKDEIRNIAKEAGLPVADKKDSQEICFIPDNNYIRFIEDSGLKLPPHGDRRLCFMMAILCSAEVLYRKVK